MSHSSEYTSDDQLYEVMCSVISKRKKCPKIITQLEEERIALSIKRLDEAKIELDDDDFKKELKATNVFVKELITKIPSESLTKDAETRFIKSKRNMENVKKFLEFRSSR